GCATSTPTQTSKPAPTTTSAPATTAPPSTSQPAPQAYKWKIETYLANTDTSVSGNIDKLIEMIKTNTKGQIELTRFPEGSIVPGKEVVNATASGMLDVAVSYGGYNTGALPAAIVEDGLPMQWTSSDQMDGIIPAFEDVLRPEYAKLGVYLLGLYNCYGGGYTTMFTKSVNSLDELKGKKVRATGGYLTLLQALGASTNTLPLGEVYQALQTGAIDGVCSVANVQTAFKFYEVAKFGILPQFNGGSTHSVFINPKSWSNLPKDLQDTVVSTFKEWRVWDSKTWNPANVAVPVSQLESLGVKFVTLSQSDIDKIMAAATLMWDNQAKDPTSAKLVEIVRNYNKANPPK
ncbi:MAG: dctP7, partial [Chloroflexi bacterium]|nr:dctP7 [Chloroflexota bacterium]